MRILVTGKTGQVSVCLQKIAPEYHHEIILIGRPEIDFEKGDEILPEIIKIAPDVVISAAAYTMVDKAETEIEIAQNINSKAPEFIAKACNILNIPLLHLSTDYVYSGDKKSPYLETDAVSPQSIYGKTKLDGENVIAAIHPNHVILRTAWVYSPYGKNFVKTMINLGATRQEISVVADQIGCPTSAIDIAHSLIKIAQIVVSDNDKKFRGIFNLAGKGETSWADFAKEIFKIKKMQTKVIDIETSQYPTPAKRPSNSRLDCSKLQNIYKIELPLWHKSLEYCINLLDNKF